MLITTLPAWQPPATARPWQPCSTPLEHPGRRLVASTTSGGVRLSRCLLGREAAGAYATGLAGPDFGVYRNGKRIATVRDSTTYLDANATTGALYQVPPGVSATDYLADS